MKKRITAVLILCMLFCMHGQQSLPLAERLRDLGYDARSLRGGYGAWLRRCTVQEDRSAEIEASLRKRSFREKLFSRFACWTEQ